MFCELKIGYTCCDSFAVHFTSNLSCIYHDLDTPAELAYSRGTCWSTVFPLMANRIMPDWLVDWIQEVIMPLFQEGVLLAVLKEVVEKPLLKKASLDPNNLNNYHRVANAPF